MEAAIQQRDSGIRAYFDTQVLKHVLNPDHQKRSLALTREICGLKVAHQQLIAAHAAAKKLAGAASLQGAALKQQLQVGRTFISISLPCWLFWPRCSIWQNVAQLHGQLCKISNATYCPGACVTTCYHVQHGNTCYQHATTVLMTNRTS